MRKRNLPVFCLCLILAVTAVGCGGKDEVSESEPAESITVEEHPTEEPGGFIDNSETPDGGEPFSVGGVEIGVSDYNVYYEGAPSAVRFSANMISTDPESDGSDGLPLMKFAEQVDAVRFGEREYTLSDLVRSRYDGFDVLRMLADDFGIDKYDPETGRLVECLKPGLTDEALREAYSERGDYEEYSVCVYYLHTEMSGMDAETYAVCRETLQTNYGVDHSQLLDGMLAVMLYYNTSGRDSFYTIAASAPGYWADADDYAANSDLMLRHDITNCHMRLTDGTPVGFVNQVFIYCDTEEPPFDTAS